MSATKEHLPKPGYSDGLRGWARCGRTAYYATGDYRLIEELALGAHNRHEADHWCRICLKDLVAHRQGDPPLPGVTP